MTEYFEITLARAKAKTPDNLWDDPTWIAEEKLDGWRFAMHFGRELARTYLTGRRLSKTTGLFSEKGLCAPTIWPKNLPSGYTVIDGEVMAPSSADFHDIAGIMNVDPVQAQERIGEIGSPVYRAFDLLWYDGQDWRERAQLERKRKLETLIPILENPLIQLVPTLPPGQNSYESIVQNGGEGVILKDAFAEYGEGWVKVKKFHTLDVVITGFTDAKVGKYDGQIGAAIVSVYSSSGNLLEIGQVSGMTDDVRADMTENPDRWIGTVIEIAAQEFAKNRLRHPRYKRHRPDVHPHAATFAKMQADLGRVVEIADHTGQLTLGF